MSPRNFLEGDHKEQMKSGVAINGPRPSPLKLKQESHTIQKQHHQQTRKPIIIYTYSPEVIHTKPHDFMALVQKLTGHNSVLKDRETRPKKTLKQKEYVDRKDYELSNDSGVTHEKITIMKGKSPIFNAHSNPYLADIPLFTPNLNDYFCSPRGFRFTDMVSSSPNMSTSLSPGSLVELMKILPDY